MAGNNLENLESNWKTGRIAVKCGMYGSHKLLDGIVLRFEPFSELPDVLNGVQEVAGSNPVAPTMQDPPGIEVLAGLLLWAGDRFAGNSAGNPPLFG